MKFSESSNKCEDDHSGDHNCSSSQTYSESSKKCEDDHSGDNCESNGNIESSNARTDCNPCDYGDLEPGWIARGLQPEPVRRQPIERQRRTRRRLPADPT